MHALKSKLQRFNKCRYNLYTGLLGSYDFGDFTMTVDHIQPDPFAPPSKLTISAPFKNTKFSPELIKTPVREYSFCDALARSIAKQIRLLTDDSNKGSGNSGLVGIRYGMQKVIESNAVIIKDECIEIKLLAGLPAFGRSIASKEAVTLLTEEIPAVIQKAVLELDDPYIEEFVVLTERQEWLRDICKEQKISAFIADGSILARASAVSDKAMSHTKAVAFQSPPELHTSITLPDGFKISGMALRSGVTLIAGGGFHGKSTLLSAIAHAIYNHIPEDGREFCVTDESAVYLRAEDGRFIGGTDISPFIHNLPLYQKSDFFESENASGSSSQAANLAESCEMHSKLLLIDEDISATNFLIRDARMRELVPDYKETITPLIAHIKNLKKQNISIIMVTGALGDFMDCADRVIVADNYIYTDQTAKAKQIIKASPVEELDSPKLNFTPNRIVLPESIQYKGKKDTAVIGGENHKIFIGRNTIDMSAWQHLYDVSQYGTIASVLAYAQDKNYLNRPPQAIWALVSADIVFYRQICCW